LAECSPSVTNRDSRAFSALAAPAVGAVVLIAMEKLAFAGATVTSPVPLTTISGPRSPLAGGDTATCARAVKATSALKAQNRCTAVKV
jgi:hypothetical protein